VQQLEEAAAKQQDARREGDERTAQFKAPAELMTRAKMEAERAAEAHREKAIVHRNLVDKLKADNQYLLAKVRELENKEAASCAGMVRFRSLENQQPPRRLRVPGSPDDGEHTDEETM